VTPAPTTVPRARRKPIPPGLVRLSKLAKLSGVPVSTIKHYVRLGLLPPPLARPNKQMAYYDEGLVDRLKAIKILQTERYLPLPAIKKILGEPPRPGEARGEALRAQQLAALAPALTPPASGWLSAAEITGNFAVTDKELAMLQAVGLVAPVRGEGGALGYADTDLEILRVIHETRAVGLGDLFPMDVLAPYVTAIRNLVKLEIDLFRHRVESGATMPQGMPLPEVAQLAQRLGERLVILLRRKLVVTELRGMGGAGGASKKPAPAGKARGKRAR
jgi:DNA-binding transcriptional MerR regulator